MADFEGALREMEKTNPKLVQEIRDRQQQIVDCRRRAAVNRDILDMRLD